MTRHARIEKELRAIRLGGGAGMAVVMVDGAVTIVMVMVSEL